MAFIGGIWSHLSFSFAADYQVDWGQASLIYEDDAFQIPYIPSMQWAWVLGWYSSMVRHHFSLGFCQIRVGSLVCLDPIKKVSMAFSVAINVSRIYGMVIFALGRCPYGWWYLGSHSVIDCVIYYGVLARFGRSIVFWTWRWSTVDPTGCWSNGSCLNVFPLGLFNGWHLALQYCFVCIVTSVVKPACIDSDVEGSQLMRMQEPIFLELSFATITSSGCWTLLLIRLRLQSTYNLNDSDLTRRLSILREVALRFQVDTSDKFGTYSLLCVWKVTMSHLILFHAYLDGNQ